ncbi:MAG: ATP-binding cassette domain-containing protein [Drouetiella hepatica Uher 2000/2452]|jgi:D-methionine transport system ATP-binding protein|uniref:ATP-binding cassette domain-containing protein n=1 Tax=Drouetiella hepatica Uher 2000/2452 TaxID=904376 RepID=A0A951Q8P5_9CYAN|nr:ATP-binding cassette domain-containing protein [Drouetiella hepatica Uher 2000/2452]
MPSPQLLLDRVSLNAGAQRLLQDISCKVFQGDRVAVVGASGAGKTSLLRLLNRLSEASQGQIFFEGQDIRQIPVIPLRQQITLVSQESKLLGMTVRQALAYPLSLRGMPKSEAQQRISTWTEQLHIPHEWLDRTEVQLSVGQRQLVAIARALVIQPKVLLLDEPTSALDAGRSHHLIETLIQTAQTQQMTIFMVNHQLELAQQFCTHVLHLRQGKLVQDLSAEQMVWADLRQGLIEAETQDIEDWE